PSADASTYGAKGRLHQTSINIALLTERGNMCRNFSLVPCATNCGGQYLYKALLLLRRWSKGVRRTIRIDYKISRASPARRVTRWRSRYSSSGIAYLRETPVKSLN